MSSDPILMHRNGQQWHDAPAPHPLHRCKWQTRGWLHSPDHPLIRDMVKRCACGAISWNGGPWQERNTRTTGYQHVMGSLAGDLLCGLLLLIPLAYLAWIILGGHR